jgi:hypothetical protein
LLARGAWIRYAAPWTQAVEKTILLINPYGTRASFGTLDAMHVALAQISGCTWFASFDTRSNARVLAAVACLKVCPALKPEEKAILSKLRKGG